MTAETSECVLAIDPGIAKCGVAVVRRDGAILLRSIVAASDVLQEVRELIGRYAPVTLVVGGGTGSKPLLRALEEAGLSIPVLRVDEAHTSEEARARYVRENPALGLQKLLPRSLRTPPFPYDDYVAVILAERYWRDAG